MLLTTKDNNVWNNTDFNDSEGKGDVEKSDSACTKVSGISSLNYLNRVYVQY